MKPRILVVADNAALRATLARCLLGAGYGVELAESLKHAHEVAASGEPALAIVSSNQPGDLGGDRVRELRSLVENVILLSDLVSEPDDLAKASGQGDSSPPQFDEQVLLARIKTVLGSELLDEKPSDGQVLTFEGYRIDPVGRTCLDPRGAEIALTRAEFALLVAFLRQPGEVLSRDTLSRLAVGRAADPDDRSIDVLISRLRRKIEPDPKTPRLIITLPGEGYKFAGRPQIVSPAADPSAPLISAGKSIDAISKPGPSANRRLPSAGLRTAAIGAAAAFAVVAVIASLQTTLWYRGNANRTALSPAAQKFHAAQVPLVNDDVRAEMASYVSQPNAKAIAISADTWGMATGAPNTEDARTQALERCKVRTSKINTFYVSVCRVYAIGDDVVWPKEALSLPLAPDFRAEPLAIAFEATTIPTFSDAIRAQVEGYVKGKDHKALAIAKRADAMWQTAVNSRQETVRLVIERCGDYYQVACLLVSVDGFLTVQVPKSRRIADIFLLTRETAMTDDDKRRVGQVYEQKEWRALARGKSGHWYPVANGLSEVAAITEALALCRKSDAECLLYAIGNFRVASEE
jgi:two-component system OmpR family response regulator